MIKIKEMSFFCFLIFVLCSCDGGSTDSGPVIIDPDEADKLVGVYIGSEMLKLMNSETQEEVDMQENEVSISVDANGVLNYSSSSGSRGSARLSDALSFELRADGRTQFDGRCSAGEIYFIGSVSDNLVKAKISSDNLICDGIAHELVGDIEASRG